METFHCTIQHPDCGGRCQHIGVVLDFLRTINDENRLRIICVLSNTQGYTVSQIVEGVQLPQNLVSHHLKAMHKIGILHKEKKGLHVFYQLDQTKIDYYTSELKVLLNQK